MPYVKAYDMDGGTPYQCEIDQSTVDAVTAQYPGQVVFSSSPLKDVPIRARPDMIWVYAPPT